MNQHRHRAGAACQLCQTGRIGEQRDGPAFDRVSVEAGTMCRRAGQCGEQVTRPHVLGAQRHTGDAQVGDDAGLMWAFGGYRTYLSGQRRQRHARNGGGAQRSGHRYHLPLSPIFKAAPSS